MQFIDQVWPGSPPSSRVEVPTAGVKNLENKRSSAFWVFPEPFMSFSLKKYNNNLLAKSRTPEWASAHQSWFLRRREQDFA